MRVIPYGRQSIDESDIAAVVEVLRSDWLTQGPAIERFEQAVAAYCGQSLSGTALANGTAALHVACLALGLGAGDTLWTSPNSFAASANCGLYCGARVDFVDIDPKTYNLCPKKLEEKLKTAEREGKLPKLVVPVHFSGQPCDMQAIRKLSKKYGFLVLEDASHAIGARYHGEPVGSCKHSDMVVFSFHPVKIVTSAEGGMIMTSNPEFRERARHLRTHGITRDAAKMTGPSEGPWYYQQTDLGYNYRISDIQAALGASQLKRIDQFIERRRQLARRYDQRLEGLPITLPFQESWSESAWHLYVIRVDAKKTRKSRLEVFEALRAAGIGVNVHYIPTHLHPYYKKLGFKEGDFPEAEKYYRETITLPLYFGMSDEEQDHVIDALKKALA